MVDAKQSVKSKEDILTRVTTVASNVIGSWWMIGAQTIAISAWFWLNVAVSSPTGRFDNERFDTLRLLLALQSVYTAPLILMAQRRIGAQDRKVLHEIDTLEKHAMELRTAADERRARLEEKVDRLLSEREAPSAVSRRAKRRRRRRRATS